MSNKWFPNIEDESVAKSLSKQGAVGVLIFLIMNLSGVAIAYFFNKSPVDAQAIDAQGVSDHVIGAIIMTPLLLLFAYRIYRGNGWLVAGIVLVWFIAEAALKVASGSANVFWVLAYCALAAMIANDARGCWWLRSAPST
ncbi:MAG: hypothetical protein WBH09_02895 [Rugosibacter sp.]